MTLASLLSVFKKEWHLPLEHKISRIMHAFSLTEKVIFFVFASLFCISAVSLLLQANGLLMAEVPDYGGTLVEGLSGSPRFINPLLAVSETDRDLSALIYSGLLKINSDGRLIPDLAESYSISDDGLVYTFTLRDNAYFHDGTKVTADDVLYTIAAAQDETLKSPRKSKWDSVRVDKKDDRTVTFTLRQAYSPFIQNATMGILPKHIWKNAGPDEFPFSQFNVRPIGSGPYKIESISYTSSGLPSEYSLVSFDAYVLGRPYVTHLILKTYQNEKDLETAYKNGSIESIHGVAPKDLPSFSGDTAAVLTAPLPRVFGVFFNQNVAPVFVNAEVRKALAMATDKTEIVESILGGFGQPISEPVPPSILGAEKETFDPARIEEAKELLRSKGWKENAEGIFEKTDKKETTELAFSISTSNIPELKQTAMMLQKQWQKIGAKVDVKIFETGDLNQNIIRPRKYDALLFGEIIGRDLDLYPFWHSSERSDPGLNIALYANIKSDKYLENIRTTSDPEEQKLLYKNFNKEISADMPAVFLYSPYFVYIVPKKVHNITLGQLTQSSERFSNIHEWYIETNKVWKIFTK